MDERVEEIKPINRVIPVRKVTLVRPSRGRRELMYQLDQKTQKPKRTMSETTKIPQGTLSSNSNCNLNSDNYAADLKKRIAFDRAIIIRD